MLIVIYNFLQDSESMYLKEIYLYPDIMDFGERITFSFKRESRSLYNYIERHLKKMKYQTINLKKFALFAKKNLFSKVISIAAIYFALVFL